MCGICGLVSRSPLTSNEIIRVQQVNAALAHRGPDGAGEYCSDNVMLAMRRLSIIDLSGGWQPLYNETRSLALIANGEIYNYVELRADLQKRGHHFSTQSDCETILHLYEDYGSDCVRFLRGMFAFALWDVDRRQLLLGRDRMGEKPLYLYERDGQLLFASELRSLIRFGGIPLDLAPDSINLYFHYQYVPEPFTPIKGIRKLPAAHTLTIEVDTWKLTEACYWQMETAPPLEGNPVDLIRSELQTVSKILIRSDVPVGIALSGGLDSSAIAALAVRQYPGVMHAFSIGYPGHTQNDETAAARTLADFLEMPFHRIELHTDEMAACFPKLVSMRDDPIADISGYGYYAVMKAAHDQGIPVMLQGQGGDELFWGYPWVREAVRQSARKSQDKVNGLLNYLEWRLPIEWSPPYIRAWLSSLAGLRTGWEHYWRDQSAPAERLVFYDLTPDFRSANQTITHFYNPTFCPQLNLTLPGELFTEPLPWSEIEPLITRLIMMTYLLENGVVQGDRLSMASSVELRLPLLDYRLVETVIGLQKIHSNRNLPPKIWLKSAMAGILPDWVLNRPKQGFTPPVREWHDAIFARYGKLLEDGYLVSAGILNAKGAKLLSKGIFPRQAISPFSFKALVLEQWAREISE